MSFLIIGSTAMYHWYQCARYPKDIDIMSPEKVHCYAPSRLLIETSWNPVFEEIMDINEDKVFLDTNLLLTLKMSHLQWDIKWLKHRHDVHFLQSIGWKKNEDIYHKLVEHWNTVHGAKKVNLNKAPDEFFNRFVKRVYNHDYLHEVVAYGGKPLHLSIQKEGHAVLSDESKFILLDRENRLKLALEELLVVAIERYQLHPDSTRVEKLMAVSGAYKKLVTTMTSGWFCDFLLDSHHEIFFKHSYMQHLNNSLFKLDKL